MLVLHQWKILFGRNIIKDGWSSLERYKTILSHQRSRAIIACAMERNGRITFNQIAYENFYP